MNISTALAQPEVSALAECEAVIQRGVDAFLDVGNALLRIRDEQLYRAEFPTFEEYCLKRWQFTRPNAYRLIAAAKVVGHLSPIGDIPSSESVCRPLTVLPPPKQREAWEAAVTASPNGQPTARQVAEAVSDLTPRYVPENGLQYAAMAIASLSKIQRNDLQRQKAFNQVERWIETNR
jgi:hypothetical protein